MHVSGARDGVSRGSRNHAWNWCSGFDGCICEIVSGGLVTNWCARAGCESISSSMSDVGVDTPNSAAASLPRDAAVLDCVDAGSGVSVLEILGFEPSGISPGATGEPLVVRIKTVPR